MKKQILRSVAVLGFVVTLVASVVIPVKEAAAGAIEASIGFSYSKNDYKDDNYSWNRKWGASIGYHFSDLAEVEFAFQESVDRTKITGYQDTTFHDVVFSINWVQSLAGKNAPVQPYVKAGIGQLNREANASYWYGTMPTTRIDEVTGVLGAGLRVYLTRTLGLKLEATSYLSGGSIATWKDNTSVTVGLSAYF